MSTTFTAYVSWSSAPLTDRLVRDALAKLHPKPKIITSLPERTVTRIPSHLLQWATYDALDHDATLFQHSPKSKSLSCAYTIRKALIRKHFLSRCTQHYVVKNPQSSLKNALPRTWEMELSFIDELDEMWGDELWDLGQLLDEGDRWFILKPGMADRGNGIRLFHCKEDLERIFEEFEDPETDDDEAADDQSGIGIATSQLRHFVIQEYLSNPLLLDPVEVPLESNSRHSRLQGHKFHIRAYCVAFGALQVYLYTRVLALFSAMPYTTPTSEEGQINADLSAHLTNTSLQVDRGEAGVRLLDELVGCHVLSAAGVSGKEPHIGGEASATFTLEDVQDIQDQMGSILGETFQAALGMSVHFQPIPNAFELYGVDFLVSHIPDASASGDDSGSKPARKFQVQLLEVNAEPAIELTGPRLTWILEDLFCMIAKTCVAPFFRGDEGSRETDETWDVGQVKENLRKCLDINVRGPGGW